MSAGGHDVTCETDSFLAFRVFDRNTNTFPHQFRWAYRTRGHAKSAIKYHCGGEWPPGFVVIEYDCSPMDMEVR